MNMSSRTFTVFQDTTSPPRTRQSSVSILSTMSAKPSNNQQQQSNGLTCLDKENLHPLTGERTGPGTTTLLTSKKRKNSVLAAKVQPSLTTKESDGSQGDGKKRKSSKTTVTSKGKTTNTKKRSISTTTTTTKKVTKKPSRRVSPLPKVDEEFDVAKEKEHRRLSQAEIDSRCYELTVQPLADLSQAYEQSQKSTTIDGPSIDEEKINFRSIKESSVEPEIRDYPCTSALSTRPTGSEVPSRLSDKQTFSTPDRKRIYAAFTFTTPSPTSKRFRAANRTNSSSSKGSAHIHTP